MKLRSFWLPVTAAFLLRLAGAGFGLPFQYHQDEPMLVHHALAMGVSQLNPHYFVIPGLVMDALFVLYGLLYAAGSALGFFSSPESFASFFLLSPTVFYLSGRILVGVLLGAASVFMLWKLCREFFSEMHGRVASGFLALSFLHVQNSRYIYADIPFTFFLICFFYAVLKLLREPRSSGEAWRAGLWLGLATAAKYNAVFAAFPAAVLLFFALPKDRLAIASKITISSALVFFLFNPYILLDWTSFLQTWKRQISAQVFTGYFYHLRYSLSEGMGLSLLLLSLAGFVPFIRLYRREGALLLLFVLSYYVLCIRLGQPYSRYAVPLVPFLCVSASFGFLALGDLVFRRKQSLRSVGFVALFIAFTALSSAKGVYSAWLAMGEDTRTQAKRWIEENIPPGEKIALDHSFFGPPLSQTREQLAGKAERALTERPGTADSLKWKLLASAPIHGKQYQVFYMVDDPNEGARFKIAEPSIPAQTGVLMDRGIKYLVFNRQDANPRIRAFRELVRDQGPPLKVFSPYRDPERAESGDPMALTADPLSSEEIFSRRSAGPYLEIFELGPRSA